LSSGAARFDFVAKSGKRDGDLVRLEVERRVRSLLEEVR
jgi:hypothetical protein